MNSRDSLLGNLAKYSALGGGLSGLMSGIFGDSGAPYRKASDILSQYLPQAQQYQMPYYEAGAEAIPKYQEFMQQFANPQEFLSKAMGQYQESPFARLQQQQATRAAQNLGSAEGLTGSSPLTQIAQKQAHDISQQDMQQYLQNILGVGQQYSGGLGNLMTRGQSAGNTLTNLMSNFAQDRAKMAYGGEFGEQQDLGQLFGGLGNLAGFLAL